MDVSKQLVFHLYYLVIFAILSDCCPPACKCLPSCYCTWTSVNCRKEKITVVTSNIPKDTCTLDLSTNAITVINKTSFRGFEKIKSLDVDGNGIGLIENGAFKRLSGLRKLSMNRNMITNIGDKLLRGLKSLEKLHLESNWIRSIDRKAFSDLISLVALNLRGNKITVFTRGLFLNNWSLSYLFIDFNPLHCNCTLDDFLSFTNERDIQVDDMTKCKRPSEFLGVSLSNVYLPFCNKLAKCERSKDILYSD